MIISLNILCTPSSRSLPPLTGTQIVQENIKLLSLSLNMFTRVWKTILQMFLFFDVCITIHNPHRVHHQDHHHLHVHWPEEGPPRPAVKSSLPPNVHCENMSSSFPQKPSLSISFTEKEWKTVVLVPRHCNMCGAVREIQMKTWQSCWKRKTTSKPKLFCHCLWHESKQWFDALDCFGNKNFETPKVVYF